MRRKKPSGLRRDIQPRVKRRDIYLDGNEIKDRSDFYIRIGKLLGWGPYFGHNLSALWDVMTTEMKLGTTLHWKNSDVSRRRLKEEFDRVEKLFEDKVIWDKKLGRTKEEQFKYIME